jgi:hypothetical protein
MASGVLGLGLGTGQTSAQDGDTAQGDGTSALMRNETFRPGALFRVDSRALGEHPDVEGVPGDEYDVRRIRYLNTDEVVRLFLPRDAEVEQGQIYRFQSNFDLLEGIDDASVISVEFEPFPETLGGDDGQFAPGEDLELVEGGGKALVRIDDFNPGALILVTIGVVEMTPPEDVRGSGVFSEYNSYLVEYLNTGQDFLLFATHEAQVEEGAVYVVRDEFDITEPEGNLVTVDLGRVDQDDVPSDYD